MSRGYSSSKPVEELRQPMHHNTSDYDQRHAAQMAVIERLVYLWRPSLSHRQWFRTTALDGEVRERMTDEEAAALDAMYEAHSRREAAQ